MKRVLVTRSEPGASQTAQRLTSLGYQPIVEPVFTVEPLDASLPAFDALAFTSLNGVRRFAELSERRDRPVFCVGGRTAEAALGAGFLQVTSADGDVGALVRLIRDRVNPQANLLHSGNEEARGDLVGQLKSCGRSAVFLATYRAAPALQAGPSLAVHLAGRPAFEAILIHSARGASILAGFLGAAGASAPVSIAALSHAAAQPLAGLARRVEIAAASSEAALLETLARIVD